MPETSVSLLLRLRRGSDQAAWDRFVELYTPLMYRWVTRLGTQASDAGDVVQDVLMTMVKVLPTFDYDRNGSFRAWLRTVVINKWRESRRKRSPTTIPGETLDDFAGEMNVRWDEAAEQAELCHRALQFIRGEFSETTWGAFTRTVVEGRPVAETAAALGMTANAIYLARSRVLARLRLELEGMWE